jgi:hypothetical protein
MKESGMMDFSMDMAYIHGQMVENISDNGNRVCLLAKVHLKRQMV